MKAPRRQRGFSLVELLVAAALGLIVLGAVLASFAGSRAASRATTGTSQLADSGRFALATLAQGLRSAGYFACNSTTINAPAVEVPGSSVGLTFTQAVTGYEAAGSAPGSTLALGASPAASGSAGSWVNALDSTLLGTAIAAPANAPNGGNVGPIAGSDVFAIHGTQSGSVPAYVTAVSSDSDFTVNRVPTTWQTGQIAAVSNCMTSAIFVMTSLTPLDIGHTPFSTPGFAPGSMIQPLATTAYYIGAGEDGDAALYAAVSNQGTGAFSANEIAADIENLQVLYGIDSGGQGAVTQYVTADQIGASASVYSVEIALLAASAPNAVTPPAAPQTYNLLGTSVTAPIDSRRRQVFTTTVALRDALN